MAYARALFPIVSLFFFEQVLAPTPLFKKNCSYSIEFCSLPTQKSKVPLRDLSHARYVQRELTHADCNLT